MESFTEKLTKITSVVTNFLLLLTPLFFLPITREFIIISKVYFFIYAVIALLVLAFIYLVITRKAVWEKNIMINGLMLLLVASAVSIIIMSPNKMQALFLPYGGFIILLSLVVFYLFAEKSARLNSGSYLFFIGLSGLISSVVSIISFVQPFRNVELPAQLAFLNNPGFNTLGTQLDYIMYTIFVLIASAAYLFANKTVVNQHHHHKKTSVTKMLFYGVFTVALIGLVLQIFQIVQAVFVNNESIVLPPLSISWYAAVEILKNPFTALFGVGVGNYAAIFTQVKDAGYNMTEFWQISSFNISRSAFMHVLTEMGIVGALAIVFTFLAVFRHLKSVSFSAAALMVYAMISFVIFPPSFINYFILFVALAYFTSQLNKKESEVYVADLSKLLPVFVTTLVLFAVFIGGVTYFASITFASEVMYKRALDAIAANDLRRLYDFQRQAIIINPYNEDFRRSFSQTNLLVANNIASKKPEEITDQDRQIITQAIQAAIAEGKASVALNSRKVTNWAYLASVYRNIINVAEGAELWTVASYQRAILLDPQNPVYRFELGGVYYLLQQYPDAQRMFEQAVSLKPDWANANYNLAWTLYQRQDYEAAVRQMERVLTLIDQKNNKADYDQAKKDLAEFQAKVENGGTATEGANLEGGEGQDSDPLTLPETPVATLEPQIELPESASPGANIQLPQGR